MEVAAEETPSSPQISNKQVSSMCEECKLNPSKYKCPGCSIRTCSLPCVKLHKQRTSCTGKRLRTQFVPLSQFNDNLLLSDYTLLEEAKRVTETAQRLRDGLCGPSFFKLPYKLRTLKNVAARRKTQLLFLPSGMSKREKNQSRFDKRKKLIIWTIEWRFHLTDIVLIDNGVDENISLCSVIEKHLKPGLCNNQLRSFCAEQLYSLRFFIRENAKGLKSPFRQLDIKAPISQQLANIVIVEYPVIHVFLPSATLDFEIVKEADRSPQKSEETEPLNYSNIPIPKGILFREEEIEDDTSQDPHVLDLMKYMNPEVADKSQSANAIKPCPKQLKTEDNNVFNGPRSKEFGDVKTSGIHFEQDGRDANTDHIGQANPDFVDSDKFLEVDQDDELEEGEILG